jgi:transposase
MVVVLGVDVHKGSHTVVAVDETGRKVGEKTIRATDAGHRQVLRWARQLAGQRRWAIEDCRHVSGRLERELLAAGEQVVRVPPKLMAGARQGARTRGKSDPIDALAVARAALREPDLPVASHDGPSRRLKLLVDRREDLVAERTRAQNRLRWHLHELDPELDPPARSLHLACHLDRLTDWLQNAQRTSGDSGEGGDEVASLVARLAADIVTDIRALTAQVNALAKEIAALVGEVAPRLMELPGCGTLTAAKIVAETAGVTRFATESRFAMHAGAAPIPASSGKTNRHRLARGGNRQLNAALHRIAVTQIRLDSLGKTYYQRRRANGDTSMAALRALKRRLARVVFNTLQPTDRATPDLLPAAA